jgi:hypothetical protein
MEAADEKMWKLDTLVPPSEEDLACVTNTVTLIYGERDAVRLSDNRSPSLIDSSRSSFSIRACRFLRSRSAISPQLDIPVKTGDSADVRIHNLF